MRLTHSPDRKRRIDQGFEVAIVAAALTTIPLTYAHMQEWDGVLLLALDWLVWAVFATEYGFAHAISGNRWQTTKARWLNVVIVILSFPPLPYLLSLTRLVRLVRPLRLIGGLRIGRPLVLLRLYVMRSVGGRRLFRKAKQAGHVDAARGKLDDATGDFRSRLPGLVMSAIDPTRWSFGSERLRQRTPRLPRQSVPVVRCSQPAPCSIIPRRVPDSSLLRFRALLHKGNAISTGSEGILPRQICSQEA